MVIENKVLHTKLRAMWDLHEGIAHDINGGSGPKAPAITPSEYYVTVALLKQLPELSPTPEWSQLWFDGLPPDFKRQMGKSFQEALDLDVSNKLHNTLLARAVNNANYFILDTTKKRVNRLQALETPSTILTGAEETLTNREQVEDIIMRSQAQDILDPTLKIMMRPRRYRSPISKTLHHGVRIVAAGEQTIAIDNEEYVLDMIDAAIYQAWGLRPISFCTLPRNEADELYKKEERILPKGAGSYIDRDSRVFGDEFDALEDRIKNLNLGFHGPTSPLFLVNSTSPGPFLLTEI